MDSTEYSGLLKGFIFCISSPFYLCRYSLLMLNVCFVFLMNITEDNGMKTIVK